jgi:transaldolase
MDAASEVATASLKVRESLKELREVAAELGCRNQVNKINDAIDFVFTVEKLLQIVAGNVSVVVSPAAAGDQT